jgi:putative FmdB family regulatory protein
VQFDRKQSFTDPVLKVCPECGKKALHKVYSPVGIVFKGSGFYATDHRSPSGQNKSKPTHEEKSASTGEASSTSDTTTNKNTESSTPTSGNTRSESTK